MEHRPTNNDCVFDLPRIDHIPYFPQHWVEFIRRNGPGVVISTSDVCKHWDEESSPDIVGHGAGREVVLDVLLVDTTTGTVRPRDAVWGTLSLLGWWCTWLGGFFVSLCVHWSIHLYSIELSGGLSGRFAASVSCYSSLCFPWSQPSWCLIEYWWEVVLPIHPARNH